MTTREAEDLIAEARSLPRGAEWVARDGGTVHVMALVRDLADRLERAEQTIEAVASFSTSWRAATDPGDAAPTVHEVCDEIDRTLSSYRRGEGGHDE